MHAWYSICDVFYKKKEKKIQCGHRYRPEIPELAPSLSRHGASTGGIQVFPAVKITVIRQVRVCCGLSAEINMHETPHGAQRSWAHFVCVSACVVGKDPNTPNWSSMADDAITRGGIGVLGSLFCICECGSNLPTGESFEYSISGCFALGYLTLHLL